MMDKVVAVFIGGYSPDGEPLAWLPGIPARDLTEDDLIEGAITLDMLPESMYSTTRVGPLVPPARTEG